MNLFGLVLFSYFLGAIPFSLIMAKTKGVSLSRSGTKNLGASNVILTTGAIPGIIALILDTVKGFLPVILARIYFGTDLSIVLVTIAAVIGHDFSIYLKFKGGKGLATTGGAFIAINPYIVFLIAATYGILYLFIIKKFIPTTLLIFTFLPVIVYLFGYNFLYIAMSIFLTLLIYWTHRSDIRDIINRSAA